MSLVTARSQMPSDSHPVDRPRPLRRTLYGGIQFLTSQTPTQQRLTLHRPPITHSADKQLKPYGRFINIPFTKIPYFRASKEPVNNLSQPSPFLMSPSVSHLSLWETAKSELRNALPRADFETWISSLQPLSIIEGKVLVLEAPSVLTEAWVNSNYAEMLRRQLTLVAGRNMDFRLTASVDASREAAPAPAPVARSSRQAATTSPASCRRTVPTSTSATAARSAPT